MPWDRKSLYTGSRFTISGVESMETLYEEMLRHRFSEGLVQDIFYHNLHRFLERAL